MEAGATIRVMVGKLRGKLGVILGIEGRFIRADVAGQTVMLRACEVVAVS